MPRKRELHDKYFKLAKAEGYVARSAYKLLQINERRHILSRGLAVLDLGCAPGSWMQVAAQRVGPTGRVVGLDLQPTDAPLPEWATPLTGDVFTTPPDDLLRTAGPDLAGGFDVVLSDMAPNTTGDPGGDHFKSVDLCRRVLAILPALLRPGGSLAMKVFEGEAYPDLLQEAAALFGFCRGYKPEATREVSREMFIIGDHFGRAGPRRPAPPPRTPQAAAPPRPKPRPGWGVGGQGAGA